MLAINGDCQLSISADQGGSVTVANSRYLLAVSCGAVVIEGRTVWHSKGAVFVLQFNRKPLLSWLLRRPDSAWMYCRCPLPRNSDVPPMVA